MSTLLDDLSEEKLLMLVFQDVFKEIIEHKDSEITSHLTFVSLTPLGTRSQQSIALARKKLTSLGTLDSFDWIPYSQFLRESLPEDDAEYLVGIYFGFVEQISSEQVYVGVFTTPFGKSPCACKISLDNSSFDVKIIRDPLSQFLFLHTPLEFDSTIKH